MTHELVIRGIPRSLARDAWWFGEEGGAPPVDGGGVHAGGPDALGPRAGRPLLILLLLLLLGDVLFWRQAPGLSLVIFVWVVFLGAAVLRARGSIARASALLLVASLPALEYMQALSVAILVAGLLGAVVWLDAERPETVRVLLRRMARLMRRLPIQAIRDLLRAATKTPLPTSGVNLRSLLRAWALPVGGGLILFSLIAEANPILAEWLALLSKFEPDLDEFLRRAIFWTGLAILIWPFLAPLPDVEGAGRPRRGLVSVSWFGLNPASALPALVTFNLLVGIQTILDVVVLLGGGGLPEGVSYSEYARQGSYPLLAITLLGGGFALAMRPFLEKRAGLRPLLYLWLFQNVLISLGAAQRLALYVEAYGLTYLRVHTMIWIPVVAIGLALTAWQVHRRHPNTWLLIRASALGFGVLYGASFVNFAGIIAGYNLSDDLRTDWVYLLEDLPQTALPVVRAEAMARGCPEYICQAAARSHAQIEDWRAWDFRRYRSDLRMQALDEREAAP